MGRYSSRHPVGVRIAAVVFTTIAHLALLGSFLGSWTHTAPIPEDQVVVHVRLIPPTAPPVPIATAKADIARPEHPAPRASRRNVGRPVPDHLPPIPSPLMFEAAQASASPTQDDTEARSDPAPPTPSSQAAAPASPSLPPAPELAGMRDTNWEGEVLARLEDFRRYPRTARMRRQQGVVYVLAMVDHHGSVLSVRLRESSGIPALDQEAMDTFARAQPLPKPPATLPDPVALEVPVEFYLR